MKIPLLLGATRRSSAADLEKSIDKENEDWERKKSIAMDDIQWYDPNEDDEVGIVRSYIVYLLPWWWLQYSIKLNMLNTINAFEGFSKVSFCV